MRDKDLDDGALDDKSWKTKHSSINQESVKVLSFMAMLLIHHGLAFSFSLLYQKEVVASHMSSTAR
jgi:hypothetical protein